MIATLEAVRWKENGVSFGILICDEVESELSLLIELTYTTPVTFNILTKRHVIMIENEKFNTLGSNLNIEVILSAN